jgi:hypothetical protein
VSWVRQFAKDSPGSEFTDSPSIEVDYAFGQSIRDAEYAFRKTQRAGRKALGKKNAAIRAQRAARRLSDKLGRMDRWSLRVGRDGEYYNSITSSKKQGRFGESLDLADSSVLARIRDGTSQTYDQANRVDFNGDLMPRIPRLPSRYPTTAERAEDPTFWSPSDVIYQIDYMAKSLFAPNSVNTSATLFVGGTGGLATSDSGRAIQVESFDQTLGARTYDTIPGTRANSRKYGLSLM